MVGQLNSFFIFHLNVNFRNLDIGKIQLNLHSMIVDFKVVLNLKQHTRWEIMYIVKCKKYAIGLLASIYDHFHASQ